MARSSKWRRWSVTNERENMKSMKKMTEEQKIEAIKAVYEAARQSFMEAYTDMGKTIAGIADVLREAE